MPDAFYSPKQDFKKEQEKAGRSLTITNVDMHC
jgi:hypothetical protein